MKLLSKIFIFILLALIYPSIALAEEHKTHPNVYSGKPIINPTLLNHQPQTDTEDQETDIKDEDSKKQEVAPVINNYYYNYSNYDDYDNYRPGILPYKTLRSNDSSTKKADSTFYNNAHRTFYPNHQPPSATSPAFTRSENSSKIRSKGNSYNNDNDYDSNDSSPNNYSNTFYNNTNVFYPNHQPGSCTSPYPVK